MAHKSFLIRSMALALVLAIPITVFGDNEVGRPSGGGSSIQWEVTVDGYERIELRVVDSCGEVHGRDFKVGTTPSFRLADLPEVVDGEYSYQLLVIPSISGDLAEKLKKLRETGDDAGARKLMCDVTTVSQTGAFTIVRGSIVNPDAKEDDAGKSSSVSNNSTTRGGGVGTNARPGKVAVNDQVIPDDLIVQGSTCTGFDCVNNENFSFDTLRLKENNLRIHFDDTSTLAGFPANDWRIIANDSASGGASKFSIEDSSGSKTPLTIRAGASTNSIFVDSTGRVGFRTSTPVLDVHINTSNTPGIRLEQNNSGGFTAQTWDIAGNEANFFIRDVTGGSRLPFRIRPGAPTSSIDIDADGIVGFGTASPSLVNGITQGVHISAEFPALRITATGAGGHDYQFQTGSSGQLGISDVTGGANNNRIFIAGTGNVGIGTTTTTSKLTVAGDVRTVGGAFIDDGTTLNAPDYVFDESYRLMPLEEVAKFIQENNHLPNVPSAKEIKANGLNISQMQMKLLEKVEELTLYSVAQQEKVKELTLYSAAQQETIKKLEARLGELEGQVKKDLSH